MPRSFEPLDLFQGWIGMRHFGRVPAAVDPDPTEIIVNKQQISYADGIGKRAEVFGL